MEYGHEKAVADGVNVGSDIYRIQTEITANGAKVDAGFYVDKRDRQTRKVRWEQLDEVLAYDGRDLDREVVTPDQIRTILTAFRDRLFTDIFPGRADVPKTLIFAKDDSHADDIVRICREVFGKGNDFCKKITYKTTGESPKSLLQKFRNSYFPRIAVTVDMIATGTDIKPLEIVFFMRSVASKNFFEQMKGRGVRIVSDTEMEQVNPGIKRKTRFVIIDAVGVCERIQTDSRPLEQKPTVTFEKLLEVVALGSTEPAALESLAGRLIRLERRLEADVEADVVKTAHGQTLSQIARGILDALDPDAILSQAKAGKTTYDEPTAAEIRAIREIRGSAAIAPLAANPELRNLLKKIQKAADQTIDIISKDALLYAGPAQKTAQNQAQLAATFRDYIETHKAEIAALQILYSRPYRQRLTEPMLKELETKLRENHAGWTEDRLWDAFAAARPGQVKGRSQPGRFADLVALVRFALEQQPVLKPFADSVHERFNEWLMDKAKQAQSGGGLPLMVRDQRRDATATSAPFFSPEQLTWLNLIRDHIATSVTIEPSDFDYAPFSQQGGLGKAYQLFGTDLNRVLAELNEVLVA
jgi:type I restriction enzyme R subunit